MPEKKFTNTDIAKCVAMRLGKSHCSHTNVSHAKRHFNLEGYALVDAMVDYYNKHGKYYRRDYASNDPIGKPCKENPAKCNERRDLMRIDMLIMAASFNARVGIVSECHRQAIVDMLEEAHKILAERIDKND